MTETANLEQTLLGTVRSLLPSQQEAVLNFARSLSPSSDSEQDRMQQALKILLDLEDVHDHHGNTRQIVLS